MTLHSPADVTFTPSFPDDFHQSNEAVPVHHRILHDSLPTDLKISMVPIQLPHLPNRHMPQTSEVWWTWRRMALTWSICLHSPIMGQFNNNESPGHAMMPLTGSHQPKKFPMYIPTHLFPLLDWCLWSRCTWPTRTSILSGAYCEDKNHIWDSSQYVLFLQRNTTLYILEVHDKHQTFLKKFVFFM